MKVKEIPLNQIKVGERFRKDYGDLNQLIESIKEKGLIQPISVDTDFNLLAGGRRYSAAQEAGLKKISCVIREVEGQIDSLEIELFENLHRKNMEWHEEVALKQRIHALMQEQNPDPNFDGDSTWSANDTARLIGETPGNLSKDLSLARMVEVAPKLREYKTKGDAQKAIKKIDRDITVEEARKRGRFQGAVKHADKHYKVGDAWAGITKVQDGVVGFIDMDPPYAIELNQVKRGMEKYARLKRYKEEGKDMYPLFCEMFARECYRIMEDRAFMVWWFGITHYQTTLDAIREAGFRVSDVPAIWYKGKSGQTNHPNINLANSYETFFVACKGKGNILRPGRSNVFDFAPIPHQSKYHPTQKPVDLYMEILETFALPSALVCVPFLGSGAMLRAAYRYGTVGYGWDHSDEYKTGFLHAVQEDLQAGLIKGTS